MKNIFFLIALGIFLTNCSKDENESNSNGFVYNGNHYETPKGFLEEREIIESNDGRRYITYFVSNSVEWNNGDFSFNGNFNAIVFWIISSSTSELASGTYEFDFFDLNDDASVYFPGTIAQLNVNPNATVESDELEVGENTTGTVSISKSSGNYKIKYSFTLENGKSVTGEFEGSLQNISFK